MRVLLTGATGFVGARVAERLRRRGDAVRALVRTPDPRLDELGVEQQVGELTDPDGLARLADGTDAAVHAAAAMGADLPQSRRVNRDGTAALVDALCARGVVRLVHVSTTSVYDRDVAGEGPITEDSPLVHDGSPYAVTKAQAEAEVARGAAAGGLAPLVLRPPSILGAGERSVWGHRVPRAVQRGEYPRRHPADTFAWVHVDDLVGTILTGLDTAEAATCNVVGGHTTQGAYLDAVADVVGAPAPVSADAEPRWRGRFATERLVRVLGQQPGRGFDEAMAEIAAWWRRTD